MEMPKVLVPIRQSDGDFCILEVSPCELSWQELRAAWMDAGIDRPICFAPPEEKLDLFFSYACQEANLPISLGTVFNPGWTEMFLNTVKHDCLVISSQIATYLAHGRLFADHLFRLKQIVIVGDVAQDVAGIIKSQMKSGMLRITPHPAQKLMS